MNNVIAGKTKGFEQTYLNVKFAILRSTLTELDYGVGNVKFYEFFKYKRGFQQKYFQARLLKKI